MEKVILNIHKIKQDFFSDEVSNLESKNNDKETIKTRLSEQAGTTIYINGWIEKTAILFSSQNYSRREILKLKEHCIQSFQYSNYDPQLAELI